MSERHIRAGEAFVRLAANDPGLKRAQEKLRIFAEQVAPLISAEQDQIRAEIRDLGITFDGSLEAWEHLARVTGIPRDAIGSMTARQIYDELRVFIDRKRLERTLSGDTKANDNSISFADAERITGISRGTFKRAADPPRSEIKLTATGSMEIQSFIDWTINHRARSSTHDVDPKPSHIKKRAEGERKTHRWRCKNRSCGWVGDPPDNLECPRCRGDLNLEPC